MPSRSRIKTRAGFTGGERGAFTVTLEPEGEKTHGILYVPPFGEEMNRCRAIVAAQARWFATNESGCTILDYFGTGESPGRLEDAALEDWIENVATSSERINEQTGSPVTLWACRLGALIAFEALSKYAMSVDKILLWQPTVSGKSFLKQQIRQRIAGRISSGKEETTKSIRQHLEDGGVLEVAGYRLAGETALKLEKLSIESSAEHAKVRKILWLEHQSDADAEITPGIQRAITSLEDRDIEVDFRRFTGPPLWQLHERDVCVDLLAKTQEAWRGH